MKSWVKPVTEVQKFEANEYVAACWGVGCDVSWSNDYEKWQGDYDNGVTHSSAHCGNSSNQVIFDDNNDGIADSDDRDRHRWPGKPGLWDLLG